MFLGIESTAHTFAAAVVDRDLRILSDRRSVMPFEEGGGIHPQQAAEHHSDVAPTIIMQALKDARTGIEEVAGIGFSAGPGLGPSLRIGATAARTISSCYGIPLYPVHHGIGHIELACQVSGSSDPLVVLVSGGHTAILGFRAGNWRVYGETLDMTLGNLLDQFARETGLPFPGGPRVEELALSGSYVEGLPYTVKGNNVVYSGLLTASIHRVEETNLENVSHTLQEVAFAMLTEATERAFVQLGKKEIVLTGGVARNSRLQSMIRDMAEAQGGKLLKADDRYDSYNGVQIAVVAALASRVDGGVSVENATVRQRWRVDEVDIPWRQDIL
jgi:N6-L-threonylcarbamoyladenine synthase